MESTFTGRKDIRRDGQDHFAEVTIRVRPSQPPSEVTLATDVLEVLGAVFGADFEYQRHNVWAAIAAHIDGVTRYTAELPHVGKTFFHAEVVRVLVSGNAGREVSGFLLSVAGMDAFGEYLEAWKKQKGTS